MRINQMNINQIQIPKNNWNNSMNIIQMANNIPMNQISPNQIINPMMFINIPKDY